MRKYYKQDSDLGLSMNGEYDNNVNSAVKTGPCGVLVHTPYQDPAFVLAL